MSKMWSNALQKREFDHKFGIKNPFGLAIPIKFC